MAKPIARKSGAHRSENTVLSFSKDPATGYFIKTEQKVRVNHLDHSSKKIGNPEVSEDLYETTSGPEFDHKFTVTGPGGKEVDILLKKVETSKKKES